MRVQLFGGVSIEGPDGVLSGRAARRHPVALVCLLAASPRGSVSRDKLVAYLWPEKDLASARNLLNQAVHALRQSLGAETIVSLGNDLALDPERASCDVWEFATAVMAADCARAVAHYKGPFLDGFFLNGSPEFEHWVDGERNRLRRSYLKSLEGLAEAEETGGNRVAAVEWWQRLTAEDPHNSRVILRVMQALESVGDSAGAIRHAADHAARLATDLGATANPEVMALAERMRRAPAEVAVESPFVPPEHGLVVAGNGRDVSGARERTDVPRGNRLRPVTVGVLGAFAITVAVVATGYGGNREGSLPTANREAYRHYQKGIELLTDRLAGPGTKDDAEWMFTQAVRLDSTFALAWAALAEWHSTAVRGGSALALAIHRPPAWPEEGRWTADTTLSMAVRYGPDLPETKAAQGWYAFNVERDRATALAFFEQARSARHDDPDLAGAIGLILISQGQWEAGVSELKRALRLEPDSHWRVALLGQMSAHVRRYDEAERWYDRVIDTAPSFAEGYIGKAIVKLKRDGDVREARDVLDAAIRNVDPSEFVLDFTRVLARHPFIRILNDFFQAQLTDTAVAFRIRERCVICYWQLQAELAERRSELATALTFHDRVLSRIGPGKRPGALSAAALGRYDDAMDWIEQVLAGDGLDDEAVSAYHMLETVAEVQLRLGEFDGAVNTLEKLLSHPGLLSVPIIELDPLWDPLRGRPDFRSLLDQYR